MKILITGANGFLGYYLIAQLLEKNYPVVATGTGICRLPFEGKENFQYVTMDFTNAAEVSEVFAKYKPTIVIHAGAMSKPDECEVNQPKAYKTNVEGTITLLANAKQHSSFFIFVSTDFVFDGEVGMYKEDDAINPVNYYGKTKLAAEKKVIEYKYDWAIARTVLVYGKPLSGRSNVLTVVKEKLEKGEEYNVVSDQVRTPTYVEDLAAGIILIIENKATGIFHLSGTDVMTPYDMAFKTAEYLGLDKKLINEVTAASFSQPAKRPLRTGFVIDKSKKILGFSPISFEEGLRKTFE